MKIPLFILTICLVLLSCNNPKNAGPAGDNVSDTINDNLPDTTHMILNWDTSIYTITACQAWPGEKFIDVSLLGENYRPGFDLRLENNSGSWKALRLSQPSLTDCLYVSSQFRILNQKIMLNKDQFNSGDKIQGSVDLIILGREGMFREPLVPFVDNRKWDTIRMTGFFSARLN